VLRKKFGIWLPRVIGCIVGFVAFLYLFVLALLMNPPIRDLDVKADWLGSIVVSLLIGYGAYRVLQAILSTVYGALKWEYPGPPLF
jgi:hypothetical protein